MTLKDVNPLLAAGAYLKRGWRPIPVPAGEKSPVLAGWQNLRLDESQLQEHFQEGSNIGLLLGEPSAGLVDVDIDHQAVFSMTDLLPPTGLQHGRTKKPASHYWYVCTGDLPETKRFQDPVTRETLIEFRSTRGQTVVPPSVYVENGAEDRLTWVQEGEPQHVDGKTLLKTVGRVAATALIAKHYPREGGSRHDIALALGGFLLRGGLLEADVNRMVEYVCKGAGDTEVGDRLKAVADTAERLKSGQPATGRQRLSEFFDKRIVSKLSEWLDLHRSEDAAWDVPLPFDESRTPEVPAQMLPGVYGDFAGALAEAAEVPEAMTVIATLGAVSAAATKKFSVSPKPGWIEPVNAYFMVALPPANNKSLVLREVVEPIEKWELNQHLAMRDEIQRATSAKRNEESTIAGLRSRAARKPNAAERERLFSEVTALEAKLTVVPVPPKVYLNDVTPESLASALADQDGKIGIISDEGGFTETIAGLYSGGHANYDIVLKGWDGGRVRLKRKDQNLDIRPYITVLLLVQPQVLRNMANQKAFKGRGLLERFLYLIPNSRLGHRRFNTRPVPPGVRDAYDSALRKLLDIPVRKNALGSEEPRLLTLSVEAARKLDELRMELEPQLTREGRLGSCAGWGGKAAGNCVRIAGLLHIMEHGESKTEIQVVTMDRAVGLCRTLLEHALAAWTMMQVDQAIQDAADVYEWIITRGEPRVWRTECLKKFHGRFTNKKRYEAALEALRHHNVLSEIRADTDAGTGRIRKYYEVNPLLFSRKA